MGEQSLTCFAYVCFMPRNDGGFLPYCCAYHELCVRTVFLSISSRPPESTHSDPRSLEEARAPTTLRYGTPSFPDSTGDVHPFGETVYGCRNHSHTADSHASNIPEFRQADGNQSEKSLPDRVK